MDKIQTGMFLEQIKFKVPVELLPRAKEALLNASSSASFKVFSLKFKSPILATLWAIFFGWCGIDCFYIKKTGAGIKRIIVTLISVLIDIGAYFLTTYVTNPWHVNLFQSLSFDLQPNVIHAIGIVVALCFAIIYVVSLIKDITLVADKTKTYNFSLLGIKEKRPAVVSSWEL